MTRKRVPSAWKEFGPRLRRALESMVEDQYLIISLKDSGRFVQFAAQGAHGLRAEVISNAYLQETEKWNDDQIRALRALGWTQPTGRPDESTPSLDPDGSPNFFRDFDNPVAFDQMVAMTERSLIEVFGAPGPYSLKYEAFDRERNKFSFPEVGLNRVSRGPQGTTKANKRLLDLMKEHTGITELAFDDDGDIGIGRDDIVVFVRFIGKPRHVRFFSPLRPGVRATKQLLRHLNEINNSFAPLHCVLHGGTIFAFHDIPAIPLVAEHVATSLDLFFERAAQMAASLGPESSAESATLKPGAPLLH